MIAWTLHGDRERQKAIEAIRAAPDLWRVTLDEPKRTDAQNDKMWAMIGDVMKQKPDWFGPGLDKEDVKQIFVTGMMKELRMVRNADGDGFIPLPARTSKFSWRKMGDLLAFIEAWCARNGVEIPG